MIRSLLLRARLLLVRHGTALALVLLVLGALSLGGAGWLYAHPPTTEVTDQTHRQTIESNVSVQAVVAANATLYEPGRVLTDRPVYLDSVASSPTLVLTTTVPEGQPVDVSQRLVVTYTATRNGETFWRRSITVSGTETTTRSGRVRTEAPLDLGAIRTRLQEVRRTVGDAGSVAVDARLVVSYDTPRYAGTLTETVDVRTGQGWYRIDAPSVSRTHATPVTRTVTVPARRGWTHVGLGALGVVALLGGVGTVIVGRVALRNVDTAPMEFELHRLRYSEWISAGTLPSDAGETAVGVASLEALVDVAIDTNGRVIHDASRGRYAVIDGSTVYRYDHSRDQ